MKNWGRMFKKRKFSFNNLFISANKNQLSNKRQFLKRRFIIFFRLLFFILILFFLNFFVCQAIFRGRIYPGVKLGNFDLGGFKKEEARIFLRPFLDGLEKDGLVFKAESPLGKKELKIQSIFVALTDPDLSQRILTFDLDETVERAYAIGRQGNLIRRLKEIYSVFRGQQFISSSFQLNETLLLEILKERFKDLEKTPQAASFFLNKEGQLEFRPEAEGYLFNYQAAVSQAKENLSLMKKESVILIPEVKLPSITLAKVKFLEEELKSIITASPFVIQYNDKEWIISKNLLIQWLEISERESPSLDLNFEKVSAFLVKIAKEIEVEPVNAKFVIEGGRVSEFQASQPGLKVDLEQTFFELKENILAKEKTSNLIVKKIEPEVLTADVNELGIKELVGRGESDFKGSPANRIHNIKTGAKVLNGLLIKPGEEFSLLKALGDVSERTGYLPELVIKADRTVPELGGGLCQIGTTAFRLALNTGLPITQRAPHAFRVIYYEPAGMDATIYNPWPDLRFINDTSAHLLLQTKIEGTKLIFEFYGTASGRQVEISESKIFNIVQPGPPLYIETTEMPAGEKKKVEKAVAGADTEFTRIITYPNGETKTEVWKSHYRPWREVWLVGVEKIREGSIENVDQTINQ